jgi:hypothetical protein
MEHPGSVTGGQRPEYLVPALIGGGIAGLMSGLPLLNCLCCLWIIGGAILATSLFAKRTGGTLTAGDGAITGALTGIAASIVFVILERSPVGQWNRSFILRLVENWVQASGQTVPQLDELRRLATTASQPLPGLVIGLFLYAAIFAALGVLGGVIGISLFGRKKMQGAPPPQGSTDATF